MWQCARPLILCVARVILKGLNYDIGIFSYLAVSAFTIATSARLASRAQQRYVCVSIRFSASVRFLIRIRCVCVVTDRFRDFPLSFPHSFFFSCSTLGREKRRFSRFSLLRGGVFCVSFLAFDRTTNVEKRCLAQGNISGVTAFRWCACNHIDGHLPLLTTFLGTSRTQSTTRTTSLSHLGSFIFRNRTREPTGGRGGRKGGFVLVTLLHVWH